jgi:hypothetical protein
MFFRRDPLIAKHYDMVIEMRAMNALEVIVAERLTEIQPDHFRAEGVAE